MIYTRPRHERKVADQLSEVSIDYFLPVTRTLRKWHDRKKYIDMPLFPSYIFVHLKDEKNYFSSLSLEGVLYYVRSGKHIARVSDELINDIRQVVGHGDEIEVSPDYFHPGRQMAINDGALAGLRCEVVRYNGREKILVRVQLLQRSLLVAMPANTLVSLPGNAGGPHSQH